MLAIGRGLMSRPRYLLLDEPSLGLAPLLIAEIFRKFAEIRAGGATILLVEQNASAALDVADHGYVLETGIIRLEGSAEIETLPEALANAQKRGNAQTALVLHGLPNASFAEIEAIAEALAEHTIGDLVVLLQTDMAKALGQALSRRTSRKVLCLDGLAAEDGDYIDIARPIGGVFPVVVHTLLFGR